MKITFITSFLVATSALAQTPPPTLVALPTPMTLSAEARDAAGKAGFLLEPLAAAPEPGKPHIGDGVVMLITLSKDKEHQQQWVAQFELDEQNTEEKKVAGSSTIEIGPTKSGRSLKLEAKTFVVAKIRVLGPFVTLPYNPKTAGKKAVDKTARTQVSPEFLSIGLDRTAELMADYKITMSSKGAEIMKQFSDEDEKSFLGGFVTLLQFFMVAQQTPGVKEIVWEIIDLPSAWSLATGLGKVKTGFDFGDVPAARLDPAGWKLPLAKLARFPFGATLNEKPAVRCEFFVTAPHPPLLTTAGIVGFTAKSPSHPDKQMLVQLLAAYRGKESLRQNEQNGQNTGAASGTGP